MTSHIPTQKPSRSPSRPGLEYGGQGEPVSTTQSHTQARQKDDSHDCTQHIQIEAWENEGGAHTSNARPGPGRGGLELSSLLTTHIDNADKLLSSGQYDEACLELRAAAARFEDYRARIEQSFDHSIARLTTMGCRATPPDPRALKLIRLRRQITA